MDARKKEVYTALYNSENSLCIRETPDQAIKPGELCDQIKQPTVFLGNGLVAYRELLSSRLKEKCIHYAPLKKLTVAASASLIASRNLKENLQNNLDSLTINYIRPSEAELNYSRAVL